MTEHSELPAEFAGRVRLFPLPNLVMFPHVVQALRVFEPRYVEMFEDSLGGDNLLAMALLEPGWERDYEGRPPIAPHVCIGKIVAHAPLPDGTFNFLLRGVARARILRELPQRAKFREAEVQVLENELSSAGAGERPEKFRLLLEAFRRRLPKGAEVEKQLEELFGTTPSLGILTDLVAYTLELPIDFRLKLLAECSVDRRAELLLQRVEALIAEPREPTRWPPGFSSN